MLRWTRLVSSLTLGVFALSGVASAAYLPARAPGLAWSVAFFASDPPEHHHAHHKSSGAAHSSGKSGSHGSGGGRSSGGSHGSSGGSHGLSGSASSGASDYHVTNYHPSSTNYHAGSHGYHPSSTNYHAGSHDYHPASTNYHAVSHKDHAASTNYHAVVHKDDPASTNYHAASTNYHAVLHKDHPASTNYHAGHVARLNSGVTSGIVGGKISDPKFYRGITGYHDAHSKLRIDRRYALHPSDYHGYWGGGWYHGYWHQYWGSQPWAWYNNNYGFWMNYNAMNVFVAETTPGVCSYWNGQAWVAWWNPPYTPYYCPY